MIRRSKIWASVMAMACGAVLGFSREARASDPSFGGALSQGNPFALGLVLVNGAFTAYDVATLATDTRALPPLAIAEIVVTVPQVFLWGTWFGKDVSNQGYPGADSAIFLVWSAALLTHGVVTVATWPSAPPSTPAPPREPPTQVHLGFAPTWFGDAARGTMMPGVAAVGTF